MQTTVATLGKFNKYYKTAILIMMVFSFIHPETGGFARGIAWEISKKIDDDWKFGDSDTRTELKQSPTCGKNL